MNSEASDLRQLRVQARLSQQKQPCERRIHVLPRELLARVVQFQIDSGLPSEVAAVRVLLEEAVSSWEARVSGIR